MVIACFSAGGELSARVEEVALHGAVGEPK